MPRERYQRGHLTKTGKTRKMWVAHWFIYEQIEDGENRKHKEKVLGPCAELTRSAAQEILDKLIRETSTVVLSQKQLQEITIAEFGGRYREMKQPGWSPHWRSVMKSLFENQINPQLGSLRMLDVRHKGLQKHLNALASSGLGYSIIHKVRTHLKAMFDEAIEADLVVKNPARLLDLPKVKKVDKAHLLKEECVGALPAARGRDRLVLRLALTLGLRPSELFALRASDVLAGCLRIVSFRQGCVT